MGDTKSINIGGAPYVFKMNGVVYHRIGPLLPAEGFSPKFAQLCMVDSADEVQSRIDVFSREDGGSLDPDPEIVSALIAMLNTHTIVWSTNLGLLGNVCAVLMCPRYLYIFWVVMAGHTVHVFLVPRLRKLLHL